MQNILVCYGYDRVLGIRVRGSAEYVDVDVVDDCSLISYPDI